MAFSGTEMWLVVMWAYCWRVCIQRSGKRTVSLFWRRYCISAPI